LELTDAHNVHISEMIFQSNPHFCMRKWRPMNHKVAFCHTSSRAPPIALRMQKPKMAESI